ncbi:PqqD family protein [Xiashengella succiniciproducens]|uniref:PqqD family protein n=1 Tax=Xiashengella succiniciproducens TaxID=2949635 RepID=A0A9J6ZQ94_9BACT|nr:PqqD family protein [Alkaliflexus sp. Ai-910]URW80058.1 PqqD family protein [Alkaliflexus sp. Ai-910]
MYKSGSIYKVRSEKVVVRKVGNEMVIVPLVNSVADMTRVLTLNETGAAIIEALDGQRTISQVEAQLISVFDVQSDILAADLQNFILDALAKGIIEEVS